MERSKPHLDEGLFFRGVAASVAVIAFFSQPVLRFANLDWLVGMSSLLGAGLFWVFTDMSRGEWKWHTWIGVALGIIGISGLAFTIQTASQASRVNDVRCDHVQNDMMSQKPSRTDTPEIFQALGCRPQGLQDYVPAQPNRSRPSPSPESPPHPIVRARSAKHSQ